MDFILFVIFNKKKINGRQKWSTITANPRCFLISFLGYCTPHFIARLINLKLNEQGLKRLTNLHPPTRIKIAHKSFFFRRICMRDMQVSKIQKTWTYFCISSVRFVLTFVCSMSSARLCSKNITKHLPWHSQCGWWDDMVEKLWLVFMILFNKFTVTNGMK